MNTIKLWATAGSVKTGDTARWEAARESEDGDASRQSAGSRPPTAMADSLKYNAGREVASEALHRGADIGDCGKGAGGYGAALLGERSKKIEALGVLGDSRHKEVRSLE